MSPEKGDIVENPAVKKRERLLWSVAFFSGLAGLGLVAGIARLSEILVGQ